MITVFLANTKVPIYSNEDAEKCREFILNRTETLSDGRKIFRLWSEDGKYYFDAGPVVFYTNVPLFDN